MRRVLQVAVRSLSHAPSPSLRLSDSVSAALRQGAPVVALESTIISHGMPYPQNVKTAREVEDVVRQHGATPATIAIIDGMLKVGLSESEMELLATDTSVSKVSRRDVSRVVARCGHGSTTVAATMMIAEMAGIDVFATGGIGGVHRGAEHSWDVSADLTELGRTRVAVVCAGAKSILDLPRTLQVLETNGVYVATVGSDAEFPAFFSRRSGLQTVDAVTVQQSADVIAVQKRLGVQSGMVFAVPIPHEYDLGSSIDEAIDLALEDATAAGIEGKDVTPFLLKRVADATKGRSLESNIALIKHNAAVAAQIACCLAELSSAHHTPASAACTGDTPPDCVWRLQPKSTTYGRIAQYAGGVGRNIAEAAARAGAAPTLVTGLGRDGGRLQQQLEAIGTRVLQAPALASGPSATYNAWLHADGSLLSAVADMRMFGDMLEYSMGLLTAELADAGPSIVCLDLNAIACPDTRAVPDAALAVLNTALKQSIVWVDPTSTQRAEMLPHILDTLRVNIISPDVYEFAAIASGLGACPRALARLEKRIQTGHAADAVLDVLSQPQLQRWFWVVKVGSEGVVAPRAASFAQLLQEGGTCSATPTYRHYLALPVDAVVNVTGAGDSLVGAMLAALAVGNADCVPRGLAAAALSVQAESAVSDKLVPGA